MQQETVGPSSHRLVTAGPACARLALLALAATLAVSLVGCGTSEKSGDADAVEVAKSIQANLERGQKLMSDARADWDMSNPTENLEGLPKLIQAEELFFEARKKSPNSSKPRIALGNCRALIGYVYFSHNLKWEEEIEKAKKEGREPPARAVEQRDENLAKARDWLEKSNRELEFYVRFLMQQFPNAFVYEQLATNYEYLGDYAAAENMLRAFMQNVQLSRESRRYYESKAKSLRQKRLDEFEG